MTSTHTADRVGRLIAARHRTGSRPGARTDAERLALVIEGGSSRGAYAHGMATAIEDLGLLPCFDAVYGASAGALTGAWLLAGQARASEITWRQEVVGRVINPARALRGGKVVDTTYLVHTVYEHILPMNFTRILTHPITFHPTATDADTGAVVDLHPALADRTTLQTALRATAALPLLADSPVTLGTRRYVDAGVAEPVPTRTALTAGATATLVLRTTTGLRSKDNPLETRLVSRVLSTTAPGAVTSWTTRTHRRHTDEQEFATHPAVLQILLPPDAPRIGRVGRNGPLLRRALDIGHTTATAMLRPYLDATP